MSTASRIGRSLRVRGKILLLFGISTALLLVAAAVGFREFHASLGVFERDVALAQSNALNAEVVEADFKKQVQEWKDTLLRGKKPEALETYWGNFQKRESDVQAESERLGRSISDPETAQLVMQFRSSHKTMGEAYRRGLQQFKDHGFDSAAGDAAVAGMDRAPTELLTKAKDRLVAQAAALTAAAAEDAGRATLISAVLFIAGTAIGMVVFLIATQKGIALPLTRLDVAMRTLADGNLDVAVPGTERKDEIGAMARAVLVFRDAGVEKERLEAQAGQQRQAAEEQRARAEEERRRNAEAQAAAAKEQAGAVAALAEGLAGLAEGDLTVRLDQGFTAGYQRIKDDFNRTIARLEETIAGIGRSTGEVANAAAEISTSTTDLSQRTEEQAASLEETSASMEEIGATVKQNANNALQAREFAAGTRAAADRGGAVVAQAVEAMSRIAESSHKISDIIGVIDEIARQTNLLALNAAVEAARAGEAGRGFAVVAAEVRSLAQRSAQAAKDINTLITKSSTEVAEGVDLVNRAGGSLAEIVEQIMRVADIVADIASASAEQATGLEQINKALAQMDEVTQQNSALVEENAATAKTLEHQSGAVSERLAAFRYGEARAQAA